MVVVVVGNVDDPSAGEKEDEAMRRPRRRPQVAARTSQADHAHWELKGQTREWGITGG